MAELSEESKRVSVQISSLSTQLIESIDRQSQLEEKLNQAKRTIQVQKESVANAGALKEETEVLKNTVIEKDAILSELNEKVKGEKELRIAAENSVDELNKEIEDLTASLFDEANNMVATARKETHAIEIKNTKLVEQLKEKDSILETLSLQLKNLKKVIQNLEDDSSAQSTNKRTSLMSDNASSSNSLKKYSTNNSNQQESFNEPVYSPNITSIRYDLGIYTEFLKFIAVLPHCESIKDTTSESKLLRRLINDEIQPIIRLDNASGLGWIVRRTLMSLMMDGLVVVEPLSGLNETFQFGPSSPQLNGNTNVTSPGRNSPKNSHLFNYPVDSPPIAVYEKCSFCGESRNDVIEHARMYVLKTLTKTEDGSLVVTNNFPLCNYCLLKLRQTCEIFAFLRSLKLGAWNLEKVTLTNIEKGESEKFSIVSKISKDPKKDEKMSQARSYFAGLNSTPKLTPRVEVPVDRVGSPTTNIQRAWLQLCKLRSTLHWAHIGIWSVSDAIGTKFGPINYEESDNDDSLRSEEKYELKKVNSEDNNFTLKEENEDKNENQIFGFETGENTPQSTGIVDESKKEENSRTPEKVGTYIETDAQEQRLERSKQEGEVSKATDSAFKENSDILKTSSLLESADESEKKKDKIKDKTGSAEFTPAPLEIEEEQSDQTKTPQLEMPNGKHLVNEKPAKKVASDNFHNGYDSSSNKDEDFDDAREEQSDV